MNGVPTVLLLSFIYQFLNLFISTVGDPSTNAFCPIVFMHIFQYF